MCPFHNLPGVPPKVFVYVLIYLLVNEHFLLGHPGYLLYRYLFYISFPNLCLTTCFGWFRGILKGGNLKPYSGEPYSGCISEAPTCRVKVHTLYIHDHQTMMVVDHLCNWSKFMPVPFKSQCRSFWIIAPHYKSLFQL